jgi:uncharacterized protein YbcI
MENHIQVDHKTKSKIAQIVLDAWENAHGHLEGHAYTMTGQDCLAVIIEDSLAQIERALAHQEKGEPLIREYLESLLHNVCLEQKEALEKIIQREIAFTRISVDVETGWVMSFFKLSQHTQFQE